MRRPLVVCALCSSIAVLSGAVALASSVTPVAAQAGSKRSLESRATHRLLGAQARATARAFPYRAANSGTVASVTFYLAPRTAASLVKVALYSDLAGRPAKLLRTDSIRSPIAGKWNRVPINGIAVAAGRRYWLAVL